MRLHFRAFIFSAICALTAFAQTSVSPIPNAAGFSGSAGFGPPPMVGLRAVTGAPYSGDEVIEQVQTLADGTHITQKGIPTKMYRDSLGRTRTERPLFRGLALAGRVPDSPVVIEIVDPVAQVKFTLDTVNKVAHRQQFQSRPELPNRAAGRGGVVQGVLPAPARMVITQGLAGGVGGAGAFSATVAAPGAGRVQPQITSENLGTQTIEGVLAEGTRQTTTWPIDSQGNDRPISVVRETWTGTTLKVLILSKSNDPRSGEHTQKLTNISTAEPDASLFQPPPDYTVVDEAGDFTIKWGSQ